MKIRLDKALVDRGLVLSRERAQAMILAGRVLVNEQKVEKPGAAVAEDAVLRLLGEDMRYVSRGGLKLEGALDTWGISVEGLACADIGASTGGFTDCMLQRGAASVLAVDTGYGQIAHKLRRDPRVTLLERTNARLLERGQLAKLMPAAITFFAMDVSFISATLVLPAVLRSLVPASCEPTSLRDVRHPHPHPEPEPVSWQGEAVMLVKPQFEAGREWVGKGGIVRDAEGHEIAIERVRTCVLENGGEVLGLIDSPILGTEGNKEFLLRARWS